MLAVTATTWAAIAAVAAAVSSLTTLGGFLLILRERRSQEVPNLYVDTESIRFNRAERRVLRPKPRDGEWVHEMVATLVNVGPGTAYGVEFTVSASSDGFPRGPGSHPWSRARNARHFPHAGKEADGFRFRAHPARLTRTDAITRHASSST
jgi:hypothetical protein